jgi:ketosteroid isomerase-like protein
MMPPSNSAEAEQAFYDAFARYDIAAMRTVWLDSAESLCIHPMGGRIQGYQAIVQSWSQIFANQSDMHIRPIDVVVSSENGLAVHHVHEEIRYGIQYRERAIVIATNVYVSTENGWKIKVHHGSPGHTPASSDQTEPPVRSEPSGRLH